MHRRHHISRIQQRPSALEAPLALPVLGVLADLDERLPGELVAAVDGVAAHDAVHGRVAGVAALNRDPAGWKESE